MALKRVQLSGNYLSAEGKRFVPIGPHWVPARDALQWAQRWDVVDIERDFENMAELGCNCVRIDLFWAWFEPYPGVYSEEAFGQFDHLLKLCERLEMYLHPTFFIGGEVGEAFWDVPWRQGRHPHADPEMLRLQTNHVSEFARRYSGNPTILAWDLTDEPPFWIVWGKTTDAMAINWTRLLAWAIRREDPTGLLCVGTSMEDLGHGPFRPDTIAAEVDFLSSHPYPIYTLDRFPDPMLSERGSYCAAFQTALCLGAGKPMMIHEFGASSAQYDPEKIGLYDRVVMYSALSHGAMGFMPWCYTDAAPETFKRVPYLRAPHETQFGITTCDRKDRPSGREVRDFSQLLKQLDLEGIEPANGEAAILVPYEWAKPHGDMSRLGLSGRGDIPYTSVQDVHGHDSEAENNVWLTGALLSSFILSRRAGFKAELPREHSDWEKYPALLLPSPLTSTEHNLVHVHTDFWERAARWVEGGGALYASVCADAAIPDMEHLFGARLSDHEPVQDTVTITLTADFGELKAGQPFHFVTQGTPRHWPATLAPSGGQVIATDQAGRPALVTHQLGQGRTLLCAYPIESYLATTPSAFEHGETTHRLYRALMDWAGIVPLFSTDVPSVEVAGLCGQERGYAVIASHSPEAHDIRLSISLKLRSLERVGAADLAQPVAVEGGWMLHLGAYEGAVLAWRV